MLLVVVVGVGCGGAGGEVSVVMSVGMLCRGNAETRIRRYAMYELDG